MLMEPKIKFANQLFFGEEKYVSTGSLEEQMLIGGILSADKSSDFYNKTRGLEQLSPEHIAGHLDGMRISGYNAIFGYDDDIPVSYIAFQDEGMNRHIFRFFTKKEYRGQGKARNLLVKLIEQSRQDEMKRIRIGKGGHNVLKSLTDYLEGIAGEIGVVGKGDSWYKILQK